MSHVLTILDYLIVFIYFAVLIGIGVVSTRKITTESDYLVAGRRLGYGLYVPAMAAVVLGGASTFGSAALGYQYGISGMWLVVMIGLGIVGMGLLFSKKLSQYNIFSVSELLGKRFGNGSRYISAAIMAVYDMMVAVTAIIAIGVMLHSIFGWSETTAILVGGIIVIFYTVLGGMWAVTLTDVIQFWVMTVGLLLLLLPISLVKVGGFQGLQEKVSADFFHIANIGGKQIFTYFLLYFFGMMIGQDIWQRAFTAKNEKTLRNGTVLAGIYCMVYGISLALVGTVASVLIPNLDDPQKALPQLTMEFLPTGMIGLVIAAVSAAVMSTASGTIMASSTLIVNDLILGKLQVENERKKVQLTRWVTVIVGAVSMVIALAIREIIVALDVAYALLSGSIFVPVLAALFWKKVTAKITMAAMIVSAAVVILDLAIEGITSLNAIIYGLISCSIVMGLGVLLESRREKNA